MRLRGIGFAALTLIVTAAFALSACGDDETTTSSSSTTSAATTSSTTTGSSTTTPGGAVVPAVPDCAKGEIYSEGSKSCVPLGSGSNPCPEGESPAADQPSCIKD